MAVTAAVVDETAGEIPILDIGRWLGGERQALAPLAGQLRHALETVGFYFIRGHGVPQAAVDDAFAAARAFHAQPLEAKLALKIDHHSNGYLPLRGNTLRTSTVAKVTRANVNEAFFVARELAADHPDVRAGKRFRGRNRWPADLPWFRAVALDYSRRMESLALALLPLYARALDLPEDHFRGAFAEPQFQQRFTHYPEQEIFDGEEFGLAPHTDTSFMTLLAQNPIPGLAIRTADGRWIEAPALPGTFLVNGGQLLQRWTNDRFLATPHRVINRSGGDRYAIPFFFDCSLEYRMVCLPTCCSPDNPPRYPPTTYLDYMIAYQNRNYDAVQTPEGKPATA